HVPESVKHLELEFEYTSQNYRSPGYILFLRNAMGNEAFNLTYSFDRGRCTISFAHDGKKILASSTFRVEELPHKLPVAIALDVEADSVTIKIGEERFTAHAGLGNTHFSPQIYFGMHNHILETASFSINSLSVVLDGNHIDFPLDESEGNDVHSADGRVMGTVSNPIWLINRSYYWTEVFSKEFDTPAGCVFAEAPGEFMIYSGDTLTTFNLRSNAEAIHKLSFAGSDWYTRLGMGIYNSADNRIISYELNSGRTFVGEIDLETFLCDVIEKGSADLQLHHHCAAYLPDSAGIYLFGGYGNRRYHNDFVSFNLETLQWDTIPFTGDRISPRFFASMGVAPDGRSLYVYGGKGNAVGNQDVGVEYYYDLYKVDLQQRTVTKLWEQPAPECDRVPTRQMIVSADGRYLYVMAYPEFHPRSVLRLYRMSVADGSCEELADSIPIVSEEIATNSVLYFSRALERLYCVVQEFEVVTESDSGGGNTVKIYSLDAPPVSLAAVRRYDHVEKQSSFWWMIFAMTLIAAIISWLYMRLKSRRSMRREHEPQPPAETADPVFAGETTCAGGHAPRQCNSLLLFGLFTACNRDGRDVAYMFTPKNRQLFVYLLINSVGKEGVLSSDLNMLFWPDKPDENIKNLKNVTINKLRKVLLEFDGIELVHHKGYFKVEISDGVYCDYVKAHSLTHGFTSSPENNTDMAELLAILSRGKFLTGMEQPIFDYERRRVENYFIPVLSARISQCFKSGDNSGTITACNALAMMDPLSEVAMKYTVKVNMRKHHEEKALSVFNNFVKEYRKTMGEEYELTFSQVTD
ncbi:MAG: hypothetical protein K2L78_06660, partial [Muribaculaceae bacterium]|nr:hypothetical protein [Muribaculaceae bacterium]